MSSSLPHTTKIAYLGPRGTFSEQALRSERDLASCELVEMATIAGAMRAAMSGDVDFAFVPIENSIEGSVSSTIDELIFGEELLIQREVVIDIHMDLMVLPGSKLSRISEVISHPHALAQVRQFLANELPKATTTVANSTADAARLVAESNRLDLAAVGPALTAQMYALEVLVSSIEDRLANETRFVLVAPRHIPARTGNDRTAVVCFQRSDRPGSLHDILEAFSARQVNLTRIESRPTKMALGDYCFVIEIEGHIGDAIVSEALHDVYGSLSSIRYLGSYPVSRTTSEEFAIPQSVERPAADQWISSLIHRIGS